MTFLDKWKSSTVDRTATLHAQCAKDLHLAASFVRSLECADHKANLEIRQIADRLEKLSRQVVRPSDKEAA